MGDYEHTATVSADPEALFRYLSDVHHLPDYFASMQEAEPTGEHAGDGEEVHVVADVEGTRREARPGSRSTTRPAPFGGDPKARTATTANCRSPRQAAALK